MTEAIELKPCPFCGGDATVSRQGSVRQSHIISCDDCGCTFETGETFTAGTMWNYRAITTLETERDRLLVDNAELARKLGGGCDASSDGIHTLIKRGKYAFCSDCGESLTGVRYNHIPRLSTQPNGEGQ